MENPVSGKQEKSIESNEIENFELREKLANAALAQLRHGVDYNSFLGIKAEFGYVFDICGRGFEALFKLITDRTVCYFACQKDTVSRIEFNEELFKDTTRNFLRLRNTESHQ